MARGFLDRLLGRAPELPADVADALAELERLAAERPALAGSAALLADLLPGLAAPAESPALFLTPEAATAKLAGGIPLLRGETAALDGKQLRRRWADVCAALRRHGRAEDGAALAACVRGERLSLEEMTAAVFAGRPEDVHARADALGLDAALAATALRFCLLPFLVPLASALAPLRAGSAWEYGSCPTCGGWPLLGEFRGLEQTRWLRCGLCATGWEFPRLACPFCGTRDHRALGYLHVEGEENRCRAAVCETCRGYVKMVAALDALSPARLLVTDLATLHLDLAAAERGCMVPGGAS